MRHPDHESNECQGYSNINQYKDFKQSQKYGKYDQK